MGVQSRSAARPVGRLRGKAGRPLLRVPAVGSVSSVRDGLSSDR